MESTVDTVPSKPSLFWPFLVGVIVVLIIIIILWVFMGSRNSPKLSGDGLNTINKFKSMKAPAATLSPRRV